MITLISDLVVNSLRSPTLRLVKRLSSKSTYIVTVVNNTIKGKVWRLQKIITPEDCTGASARFSALLGVTLAGEKFFPCIIFKEMPNFGVPQEIFQVDPNVVCAVQKNLWMGKTTFLYWTESI